MGYTTPMKKEFVAWLCGLISADGNVGCFYLKDSRNQRKYRGGNLTIYTAEENWARQIAEIIETNGLSCHLLECHRDRPRRGWRTEWRIDIHKHRPKRKKSGANQWQEIVDAVGRCGYENLMMKRKLETLRKIALL